MHLTITSPAEGQKVEQGRPVKIAGAADSPVAKVVVFADDVVLGGFEVKDGKWSFTRPFSQTGPRQLKVQGLNSSDALVAETVRSILVETGWTAPLPVGSYRDGSYPSDSGADLHCPRGTDVFAVAPGLLLYSEPGHVESYEGHEHEDTRLSILLQLDEPLVHNGVVYPFVWYTHLSVLTHSVRSGAQPKRVAKGDRLGKTGLGRGVPHLHFGVIHNRRQLRTGDWMPPSEVVRIVRTLHS